MTSDRRVWAAVGAALFGVALLVLLVPAVGSIVPVAAVVAALGNDYLLVAALAALVLVATLAVLGLRWVTGVSEATTPTVETAASGAPGRDVDETLDSLPPVRVTPAQRRLHRRLRSAAIGVVAEATQRSRGDARARVEDGTWTDDAEAAAFVADEELQPPPVAQRLGARLRREHWFRRRVAATVASIETVTEEST